MDWAHVQELLEDCPDKLAVLNLHTELEPKCQGEKEIYQLADMVFEILHALEVVPEHDQH